MVTMFGWWKKQKDEPPLVPGPVGPRVKSYSAASGFVYEYAFIGQRNRSGETEYIFDVSYDRVTHHRISVWVSEHALRQWVEGNGRELRASERYAIAKLALRNAFDERATPEAIHRKIAPGALEVAMILEELDV